MDRFGGAQVYEGGLTVYTTLDLGSAASGGAIDGDPARGDRGGEGDRATGACCARRFAATARSRTGAKTAYLQGALVALEPQNGAIRALVGGRSFAESHFNRAVQARRQPGSAFKPIVAAQALRQGYGPNSILQDSPVSYHWGGQTWSPQNFDHKFRGPVTLRYTLQKSINVPTIRLLEAIGAEERGGDGGADGFLRPHHAATFSRPRHRGGHARGDHLRLRELRQSRHPGRAVCHRSRRRPFGADPARAPTGLARGAGRAEQLHHDQPAAFRHRPRHRLPRAREVPLRRARPPARPAPPTTTATLGSSGSSRDSPVASGSASMPAGRSAHA